MNLAKMTYGGRITIPREIRSALKMKTGDSLIFFLKGNGEVVVNNAALIAVEEAQNAVHGSAYSDDEILADVMELRYGRSST